MFYQLYELNHAFLSPARAVNDAMRLYYKNPLNPMSHTAWGRQIAAAGDVFERLTRRYAKPEFGLVQTEVDGHKVAVTEEVVWERPFCRLLHFARARPAGAPRQPNLVIVAPMSGHYATLLRGTVAALLPTHEVFITDWADARMVPLAAGRFDLDDYIDYVTDIVRHFSGDVHMVAVCQPAVPVFAATALMEADGGIHPKSITLMGGPIDTRENPTEVNLYAAKHDLDWFRRNVIQPVPFPHPGMMRQVYPGFLQLTGFMTMNLDRHMSAHYDYFDHLVKGDGEPTEKHREFYDEYMSVMDLTAEFYLQTVDTVFLRHALPRGLMRHRNRMVDPRRINRTPILTVEGENDDISGIGQTRAAQKLTPNLPEEMHAHYEQAGVGHYGVFNGSRFRSGIAPRITEWVARWDVLAPVLAMPRPEPFAGAGPIEVAVSAATEVVAAGAGAAAATMLSLAVPATQHAAADAGPRGGGEPREPAAGDDAPPAASPEETAEDALGALGGDRDVASTPAEADEAAEPKDAASDADAAAQHDASAQDADAAEQHDATAEDADAADDEPGVENNAHPLSAAVALPAESAVADHEGPAGFADDAALALATPIDGSDDLAHDTGDNGDDAEPAAAGIAFAAPDTAHKRKISFRRR